MRGFEENNCRLCEKVFCCEKCRIKHEANYHKVFPECDLCIHGHFIFDNIDETYLQHLESSHLPLNCVYCKRVFNTIEEILQHKKCPVLQQKDDSPKTPFRNGTPSILVSADDQDSPILQESQRKEALNYIFNLATSTPMQGGEEPNIIFGKSKESITPVDRHPKLINKSIIKKTDSMKADNSSKRRVTFGETPSTANRNKEDTKNISNQDDEISNKKNADTDHTPVTGLSADQFYSAKSEVEQFSRAKTDISNIVRENRLGQLASEAFTPVCVPTKSKISNMKEDNTQNSRSNGSPDGNSNLLSPDEHKTQDSNLNEEPMEICTPARTSEPTVREIIESAAKPNEDSSDFAENRCSSESKLPTHAYTLANQGETLAEGATYENSESVTEKRSEISSTGQEKQVDGIDSETNLGIAQPDITNANNCNTLWLSAINLNDSNDSDAENKERDKDEHKKSDSPPKPERRRVSVVMPTPILKKTNVKMKFHIPAHFASTPIVSSGIVKLKQTRIVEQMPTEVLSQQTPFKTPLGKLSEFAECNFIRANSHESFFHNETDSCKNENSPDNHNPREFTTYHSDIGDGLCKAHGSSTSVSSMTESSLWTSMTRIVKSVLGGFTNMNQDSNICLNRTSNSSKRQLSDPDSDFLEAPRLKRFKFTDIKCRRPIRNLPALTERPRLPAPTNQVATFEIVRSVSTLYGGSRMRIQCDKATQTDDYLMYGWHPKA